VQVTIHFTPSLLAALDARADAQGEKRSAWLRELLSAALEPQKTKG
jgi:metal-responsive CopG/Arc/MetJ family transcriptional regulator